MMVLDKNDPNYRQCSLSVMDNIADPDITFDENGICNYYYEYLAAEKQHVLKGEDGEKKYKEIISKIKSDGQGKKYDCILGVSGGVDSTYLAYLSKQAGLRVLCVHFDNGWNSELAVKNIQNIVEKCGFDLYTYVIDWEEFRDIQLAYFKANVIDIEAVTDIAISNTLYSIAFKNKINYILSGTNISTETTLPISWVCKDQGNLISIHSIFGSRKLKKYPILTRLKRNYIDFTHKIVWVDLLNYVDYNKIMVREIIEEKLDWKYYGGKHFESVFTKFYQGILLPQKFKVDKRKAHLSNLIFSGQLNKEDALEELQNEILSIEEMNSVLNFVLKKLGFSKSEFADYLNTIGQNHDRFGLTQSLSKSFPILKIFLPFKKYFKIIKS